MKSDKEHILGHYYTVECLDVNGNVKSSQKFQNLVPVVGRNHYLNATLKTDNSPQLVSSLKTVGTPLDSDVAENHPNWSFITNWVDSDGNAFAEGITFGTASGGSISTTAASKFTFTGSATVGGFVFWKRGPSQGFNQNPPAGNILLGIGDFDTPINVINGDIINVSLTCSITSV